MEKIKKVLSKIWSFKWVIFTVLFMLGAPVLAYVMMEEFTYGIGELASTEILFFNILFVYIIEFVLLALTFSPRISCFLTVIICGALGMAEYMVMSFRSLPIMPWDLLSFGTAMSVAGEYKTEFTKKVVTLIVCFALLAISSLVLCRTRIKLKMALWAKIGVRVLCILLCVPMLMGYAKTAQDEDYQASVRYYPYLFTPTVVYRENGFYFSFVSLLKYMDVSEPKGYNVEKLEAKAEEIEGKSEEQGDGKRPNIIVVMNESFADLSVLADFEISEEPMPFFKSLTENTVKGEAYVSVKGGNTPNSEWEFLTGNTMAFLPSGSIPYQQYMTTETPNLMSTLGELGYTTYGIHPYGSTGWKRNTVYPLLGIENNYFSSSFSRKNMVRNYISDEAVYDKIIRLYCDNLMNDDPLAFFAVTMQNHGGYANVLDYDNFSPFIQVDGMRNKTSISGYMSLIKISDDALKYLIEFFEEQSEPTVILMFGDHQPNSSITKYILESAGIDENTDDWNERSNQFIVPFLIWANYDIEEKQDVTTSLNYLNIYLSEAAGIELSDYQLFRRDLMEKYPVITANFCINDRGELRTWSELDPDKDADLLLYKQLQYNHTFDTDNTLEGFFD